MPSYSVPSRACLASAGFSVTIFASFAFAALAGLSLRRFALGYELGGRYRYPTALALVTLWLGYVALSSLCTYGLIESF